MDYPQAEDQNDVLRSEPCERKGKTWLDPVYRFVHGVQPPRFPDSTVRETNQAIATLTKFARVLSSGYNISASIAPAQDSLFRHVLAQYCHFVLKPARLWLGAKSQDGPLLRAFESQVLVVESLMPKDHDPNQWITLTVFDLMYAALAWHFGPEPGMQGRFEKDAHCPDIIAWRKLAKNFTPLAVTYDIQSQIVGLSAGKWERQTWLKDWEAGLRDARIAPRVRVYLTETQQMFKQIDRTVSPAAQLENAIEMTSRLPEGEQLCHQLCGGRLWYTISGQDLQQKDPCSMCRAFYEGTILLAGLLDSPSASLFERRGERAWQCAESCVMSQLWDLSQQERSEAHQRAPRSIPSRSVLLPSIEWRSGVCGQIAEDAALRRSALSVAALVC